MLDMDKQSLRERVWDELEGSGEARFPYPPHGRIPNFAGAGRGAGRLIETDEWQQAKTIKANPDSPQLPVRRAALRAGKTIYMAVPQLREEEPFLRLDPAEIEDYDRATTVGGSAELGVPVDPEEMEPIDLIVSGSVAVSEAGVRIGKGEGYSDLEYAVCREFGLVDSATPVATTVHERQVLGEDLAPDAHDVPLALLVTPERVHRTVMPFDYPVGIDWEALSEERLAEIPVLDRLRP
jgi:5-formyltetrahydrofolate cyclo-ligase